MSRFSAECSCECDDWRIVVRSREMAYRSLMTVAVVFGLALLAGFGGDNVAAGQVVKRGGTGAPTVATGGTVYAAPPTSGTGILKSNGSGGFSDAISGTDYAPATTGKADSPLLTNGTGGFTSGTLQGNTTKLAAVAGTFVPGNCRSTDANGNEVDSGHTCGASGGNTRPIRLPMPITAAPVADQTWSLHLIDNVSFPANFSGSLPDGISDGSCDTNPSEVDAYRLRCSTTDIGSVVISTAGALTFETGTRPYIRASTTATPGKNGGSISVPSGTVNGDLLMLIAAEGDTCAAGNVTGGTWVLAGKVLQTAYSCIYTRIAASEPASYICCGANSYPAMVMLDISNAANTTTLDAIALGNGSNALPKIAALTGPLGSSQDLFIGHIGPVFDAAHVLTPPAGLIPAANIPYSDGNNYSNWAGQVSLTAASTSAFTGSLSAPASWTSFAIAVAPAVNGGTASCNNNPIEWIAPHTVSGFCRMTLGGHAPNS